jgi:hypothetical protein
MLHFLKKYRFQTAAAILFLFPILTLLYNFKSIKYNCLNVFDFGIYQQAIYEIASGHGLNPYASLRNLKILNDHFDPIIILAAPWVKLFNFEAYSLILWEWFFYISFPLLAFFLFKKHERRETLLLLFMIFFSKGLLNGTIYPIHASFWSIPFWFLLSLFIHKNNYWGVTFCSVALFCFKELYTLAIFSLSFYYLFTKDYKKFISLSSLSSLAIAFAFFIRPRLFGEIYSYSGNLTAPMLAHPIIFFYQKLTTFDFLGNLKVFLPFLLLLGWAIKKYKFNLKSPLMPFVFLLAPLFTIQFIFSSLLFQYAFPLVVCFLTLSFTCGFINQCWQNKYLLWSILFLFLLNGSPAYTKILKFIIAGQGANCVPSDQRYKQTEKLKLNSMVILSRETVATSGGAIIGILRPGMLAYHLGGHFKKIKKYDYLLLDMNGNGDTYPLNSQETNLIQKRCQEYASEIIQDDNSYFLAKGPFPLSCI